MIARRYFSLFLPHVIPPIPRTQPRAARSGELHAWAVFGAGGGGVGEDAGDYAQDWAVDSKRDGG